MKYLFLYLILTGAASCSEHAKKNNSPNAKSVIFEFLSKFSLKTYEQSYGTSRDIYFKDSLVLRNWYDSLGILRLQTPIQTTLVGKTIFRFTSGRNYFDQDKIDTIILINNGLPDFNRGISISGALITHIKDSAWQIRTSKHFDGLDQLIIKIEIYQHLDPPKGIPIIFDTLIIPVK